jgi:hypothetical protein
MINPDQLQASKQGKLNIPRMIAIFLSRQYAQLVYKKISDFYKQISTDSVGLAIKRFEKRAATNVKISKCLK